MDQGSHGSGPNEPSELRRKRRRAWLRFLLGNAQMFCAALALILLFKHGITWGPLIAALTAILLTTISRSIFIHENTEGLIHPVEPPNHRRGH